MSYYYLKNPQYEIHVTDETSKLKFPCFLEEGKLWEDESITQFFNIILQKKDKFNLVDIGAQVGLYTLFAKYLPLATFYSFEPFPATFKLLNDNIKLNEITNVNTYNMAVAEKTGTTIMNTSISHFGLHTLGQNPVRFSDIHKIEVQTTSLDDFFYSKDISVDFIKIDTEGYEYFILKGGVNTLKKYKPIIQSEWNADNMRQCGVNESMFRELLETLDYRLVWTGYEEVLLVPK